MWNYKPIFEDEPADNLENLATLNTFTGSLDESWFYLVSVAIEARGAPILSLMLDAMAFARANNSKAVAAALQVFAERLDELGSVLERMYENCDPHVFYHRIRPFLAGSKNMADAGLPNGVIYDDGSNSNEYRQYGGGSNAQSSLIQFFDIVLGVSHRPTGSGPPSAHNANSPTAPPSQNNFIHEMRSYMPGPHARFLNDVSAAANIRSFVSSRPNDKPLTLAYDACLAMLRALRDKHIRMVSRYIIVKSRESRSHERSLSPTAAPPVTQPLNLASGTRTATGASGPPLSAPAQRVKDRTHSGSGSGISGDEKDSPKRPGRSKMRGTGGTALIPFLKQARDETGEPAIDVWAQRLLGDKPAYARRRGPSINVSDFGGTGVDVAGSRVGAKKEVQLSTYGEHADGVVEIVGLAGTWGMDESDSAGGLCHW